MAADKHPAMPALGRFIGNFDIIASHLWKHCGIPTWLASERLHQLKEDHGRGPADDVLLDYSGGVWSPESGELLGSLTEGGGRGYGDVR